MIRLQRSLACFKRDDKRMDATRARWTLYMCIFIITLWVIDLDRRGGEQYAVNQLYDWDTYILFER